MRLIRDIIDDFKKIQLEFEQTNDKEAIRNCIDAYTSLLNDAPDDPEILFQLGAAYLQLGLFGASLVYFDRCQDYWPDMPQIFSNIGCAWRSVHMIEPARDNFAKAIMLGAGHETYSNMASSFINEDCPEEGMIWAEKAMELEPDSAKARWNYSLLCLELGQWDKGFTYYDAGLFCGERQMRNYGHPDTTQWFMGVAA